MMRVSLWPQSLFGRLLAASVAAVLLAQAVGLFLIAQEREGFVLQGSVREWSRRIAETTLMLQPLSAVERAAEVGRLSAAHERLYMPQIFAAGHGHEPGAAGHGFVRLPLLSTWLGHVDPASTYWYLRAVPELLAHAANPHLRAADCLTPVELSASCNRKCRSTTVSLRPRSNS